MLRKSPAMLCMKVASASLSAIKVRWGLFGHVMRMAYDTPAQMAIYEYIAPTVTAGWQGRPRTTLPTTLDNDLQGVGKRLRNKRDLQHLKLTFRKYPAIRTNYIISHSTTLQYNHNI